jgi:hypothetical protein
MASVHKTDVQNAVIRVFTTPAELRELAAQMEKVWSKKKLGEDLTVATWNGTGVEILFVCDQDLMRR